MLFVAVVKMVADNGKFRSALLKTNISLDAYRLFRKLVSRNSCTFQFYLAYYFVNLITFYYCTLRWGRE